MSLNATSYNPVRTPVHQIDARVKVLLVLVYSISLFFIQSWTGLALSFLLLALCVGLSRLHLLSCLKQLLPLGLILAFTLLANSFSFQMGSQVELAGIGAVSAGVFQTMGPVSIVGGFGFIPAGFARGCFYVLRIAFLVFGSLVLVTTTRSTELSQAISSFLSPLERFGFPVHDVSTTISIALRFIPVTVDEFQAVRTAQASRGADFESGGLVGKLKMWGSVLIPMFVGLFRRADRLATAMDARCYGAGKASSLNESKMSPVSLLVLVIGLTFCLVLAVCF